MHKISISLRQHIEIPVSAQVTYVSGDRTLIIQNVRPWQNLFGVLTSINCWKINQATKYVFPFIKFACLSSQNFGLTQDI